MRRIPAATIASGLPAGFAQLADSLDFLAGFAQTHTQGTADAIGAAQASGLRLIRDRVRSALLAVRRILPADTAAPALILGALMVAEILLVFDGRYRCLAALHLPGPALASPLRELSDRVLTEAAPRRGRVVRRSGGWR